MPRRYINKCKTRKKR